MGILDDAADFVNDALDDVTDFLTDTILDLVPGFVPIDFGNSPFAVLLGGPTAIIGLFDRLIAENNGSLTPESLINEFVPDEIQPLLDIPNPVTGISPREEMSDAFASGNTDLFIDNVASFSGVPADQVDQVKDSMRSAFDLITLTRAGEVIIDRSNLTLPISLDITGTFGTDSPTFGTFVSSIEELELEMRSISGRDITEVIVHWTETYSNANLDADQIKNMAVEFGASDMPYHYVIKRDGSLQRGLSADSVGEHCPEASHDNTSLGIIFVGGLNIATGDDGYAQPSSLTRAQFNTFYEFMRVFFDVFPGGQALGHRDVVAGRNDPGFDVRQYVFNTFGKVSLYDDPANEYYNKFAISNFRLNTKTTGYEWFNETDLEDEFGYDGG